MKTKPNAVTFEFEDRYYGWITFTSPRHAVITLLVNEHGTSQHVTGVYSFQPGVTKQAKLATIEKAFERGWLEDLYFLHKREHPHAKIQNYMF